MTLYDLVNGTTLQGDIRLSVWDEDGEEVAVEEYENCEDLSSADLSCYEELAVNYVFVGGDSKLHIELEGYAGWMHEEEEVECEELPVKVILVAGGVRHYCNEFETEDEAEDFCEYYNYRMVDENGFEWRMEIEVDD